jgi:hypothetical protein
MSFAPTALRHFMSPLLYPMRYTHRALPQLFCNRLPTLGPPSYSEKRLTEALLRLSNNVGVQFRRLRTKLGAPVAINAMAAKLLQTTVHQLCTKIWLRCPTVSEHYLDEFHRVIQDLPRTKWCNPSVNGAWSNLITIYRSGSFPR